jgi:hypothetical protein
MNMRDSLLIVILATGGKYLSVEADEILNIHGPPEKISWFTSELKTSANLRCFSDNATEGYNGINALGSKGCEFFTH